MYTVSLTDPIVQAHLRELGAPYRVFARIESPELRRQAAGLIDFLQGERFAVPDHLGDPPDAIPCLLAAVRAAHPDRKCAAYVISDFPGWLAGVAEGSREAFLSGFPELAPAAYDLGAAGMKQVVDVVNAEPRTLKPVAAYALTTAEAIRAVVRIAHGAVEHGRLDLLDGMVAAFPAARMEESKEAERIPHGIAETSAAAGAAWPLAMELCLDLVKRNLSSAHSAMSSLPGILKKSADAAAYLGDFRSIVDAMDIQALGACLHALPGWHAKGGAAATRRFVALACQASDEFGVVAGMAFLERKTTSSRQLLP